MPHKNQPQKSKLHLIFGTITALFLVIMGYEVIRENTSKRQSQSSGKKFLIASSISKDLYQKPDRVELNLLNAQNQHFLNKIISLKEESYENSKRLHILQSSLLAAKTAKENEEIQNLKSSLRQEETLKLDLTKDLTNLNQNIGIKEIQIIELESLIDFLNDLVESQKKHKQQSNAHFKTKFDTFQKESTDEKERLCGLIHDLEVNQTLLKIQMQDHDMELQKLQSALSQANVVAIDKEFEFDCLQDDFKEKEITLNDQAKDLCLAIETEQLIYMALQNELYYLKTELAVQIEKLKQLEIELTTAYNSSDEQNRQIAFLNHEINQKSEELLASRQMNGKLESDIKDEESKSIEQAISYLSENYLHEELAITLMNDLQAKQLELEKLKTLHHALSHDRNALKNLIDQKNQIISDLNESALNASFQHESTTQLLQEKIDSLYTNLDSGFGKIEELNKELEKVQAELLEKDNLNELEKAYSQDLKKHLSELYDKLTSQDHELTEIKKTVLLKQKTNEELSELLSYNETTREIELAEAKGASISYEQSNAYLNELLEAHKKELAEIKEAYTFNERFNTHLNELLNVREKELIDVNDAHLALTQSHQNLNELLASREKEIEDVKQAKFYHEQSNTHLESNLLALEKELTDLKFNFDENSSLNDKIKMELELYKEALDKALILEDIEKRTAQELELKLENINQLLKNRDEELVQTHEALNGHNLINETLKKEIQKQEEAFKLALNQYEEAQKNTLENERNLNQLTEVLLHREKELAELKEIITETSVSNKMLADEVEQQQKSLNQSIANYTEAEKKSMETTKNLLHISEMLQVREQQLLESDAINFQTKLENEQLAKKLHQYNQELKHALEQHQLAQHNTHENEKELHTLIELLTGREKELLNSLESQMSEKQQLEYKNLETKEYLNKIEQSRHNLQNELDKIRESYANLLNRVSDKDEINKQPILKSHTVISGDTLRGLALRYYGSPNRWKEIYQANQLMITDQNKIPVGTVLTIP